MSHHMFRVLVVGAMGLTFLTVNGCGGPANNGLASEVTVQLPDGTSTTATLGSGVIALADSSWEFFTTAINGQGVPFVVITFGPNGELTEFNDNTLGADIFGSTILFDGARHNTAQSGLQYAAATFGAQTSDATGFTLAADISVFAVGLEAATATATATGMFDANDPDVMTGTFDFVSTVTLLDIPEGNQNISISFLGRRKP